jgi:hypothetical protein
MKIKFTAAFAMLAAMSMAHATDVGVSIAISQPGVYGRIDIGRFPHPAVVVPRPVIIAPPPVMAFPPQPVYLWVPPGHQKKWAKHCGRYSACGVPVYFVRDDWYEKNVRHSGRTPHGNGADGPGEGKGRGKGNS